MYMHERAYRVATELVAYKYLYKLDIHKMPGYVLTCNSNGNTLVKLDTIILSHWVWKVWGDTEAEILIQLLDQATLAEDTHTQYSPETTVCVCVWVCVCACIVCLLDIMILIRPQYRNMPTNGTDGRLINDKAV